MLLFTSLFGVLMLLSMESRRRVLAVLLISSITIIAISPPPAQAQSFCLPCVIQKVLVTITVTIGGWLNQINGVLAKIFALFQQTVWPPGKITLAKLQIQSIITQFLGVVGSIMSINPHTATLPNPVALESIIRNLMASSDSTNSGQFGSCTLTTSPGRIPRASSASANRSARSSSVW